MENRIVMTLDAGGTNFVFSAIMGEKEIVEPVVMPSMAHDLDLCLRTIIKGFEKVKEQLPHQATAISFAFPGPADYARGIIGDLGNLPAFRGGVALGPMLEEHFRIPVFINNDGDLFAYGEAMFGFLPFVNQQLQQAGSNRLFSSLLGVTLGTGFGGGFVTQGKLYRGENGAAAEVWLLRDPFNARSFIEEQISARAIIRNYSNALQKPADNLTPLDVYCIATGEKEGNQQAALESFEQFGSALGMALAEIVTFTDSLMVIGGGLANAAKLFFPAMLNELNGSFETNGGTLLPRLVMEVFDLEQESNFDRFARGGQKTIQVPFSQQQLQYDPVKSTGIGISKLGTSKAVALGAYAFALREMQ